jgi:hypothetical protein
MAGEWAYLVSGAAQARTAAPTPPIGRSQILAIGLQVGKVSLVCLLSQFGHEVTSDIAAAKAANRTSNGSPSYFYAVARYFPMGRFSAFLLLPTIAFNCSEHRGERHGSGIGEIEQAHDTAASVAGNGPTRR